MKCQRTKGHARQTAQADVAIGDRARLVEEVARERDAKDSQGIATSYFSTYCDSA